jgi:hypothetical protein
VDPTARTAWSRKAIPHPTFPGGPGRGGRGGLAMMMAPGNRARIMGTQATVTDLAARLTDMLSRPVSLRGIRLTPQRPPKAGVVPRGGDREAGAPFPPTRDIYFIFNKSRSPLGGL